jgi:hypothetical protein
VLGSDSTTGHETAEFRRVPLAVGFCAVGAGIANGVGHVALALVQRGYFPGLLTAPLCFVAGVALLRSIWQRGPAGVG